MQKIIVLPIDEETTVKITIEILHGDESAPEENPFSSRQLDIMDLLRHLSSNVEFEDDEDEEVEDEVEELRVDTEQELRPISVLETNPEQKLVPIIKIGE